MVWIDYCKRQGLDHKLVNSRASDIVGQVGDCDIVMWQYTHFEVPDKLIGKQVLAALASSPERQSFLIIEQVGTSTTRSLKITCWRQSGHRCSEPHSSPQRAAWCGRSPRELGGGEHSATP